MDVLPDEVLLEIFDFHLKRTEDMDAWHTLIHVCRRWRHLVLSSSRRLDLRIFCTDKRPVRTMLDIWPAFPLVVWNSLGILVHEDNIIAALEHPDRVCEIGFGISSEMLEILSVAMEVPFPVLSAEHLCPRARPVSVYLQIPLASPATLDPVLWTSLVSF